LDKIFTTGHAGKLVWVAFSGQMLDAGCWISRNAHMVKSKNIEDPETRIQDQPILARVFVATVWIGYNILCNNRVKSIIFLNDL